MFETGAPTRNQKTQKLFDGAAAIKIAGQSLYGCAWCFLLSPAGQKDHDLFRPHKHICAIGKFRHRVLWGAAAWFFVLAQLGIQKMRRLVLILILALLSPGLTQAAGLSISFYGEPFVFPPGRRLSVAPGVNPDSPVVFDLSQSDRVVLRPVAEGEADTEAQPHFRFEWQDSQSARFYRLTPSLVLAMLSAANAKDTESAQGRAYEQKAIEQYLRQGQILRSCLPATAPFQGSLTLFLVISAAGKIENTYIQPEGRVAECLIEQAKDAVVDQPPHAASFTAKAVINLEH